MGSGWLTAGTTTHSHSSIHTQCRKPSTVTTATAAVASSQTSTAAA